jgi:hypothetical protein
MKKIFVLTIVLLAVFALQPAFSQLQLGGSLNFGYTSTTPSGGTSTSSMAFGVQPIVLYSLSDSLDIGGTVGITWIEDRSTTFTLGPIARFYFLDLGGVAVYAGGALTFLSTSYKTARPDEKEIRLAVNLGGDLITTGNLSFFAELGVVSYSYSWTDNSSTSTFTIPFNTYTQTSQSVQNVSISNFSFPLSLGILFRL